MSISDQHWFSNISRPSRYLGGEINAVRKNPAETEVGIALAFPDVYDVGMSHLGMKILYNILNNHSWLLAERVFCPWVDLEYELRSHNIPLTTLESGRPLSDFDIVGFSLQYELGYTNVLNMLDLAGISLLAAERGNGDPLIIAGGPACFNPEPVSDFFDLMVIGDGEETVVQICRVIRETKRKGEKDKQTLLSRLHHIKGVYIPSFFSVHYNVDGSIDAVEPLVADYRTVRKAVVKDIGDYPPPEHPVVPFTGLVHDRLAIEIYRGCTRGCRFCQAGMIYRPVRERSPESVLKSADRALTFTGYEDLSLLSLSSGDYSCIDWLLMALMDRQADQKVALSLPSLRVDSLTSSVIEQIKRVRKTGFTLAPEAGNERLRRIINKGLTQDEIKETARMVYGAGWNLIKLYFMIGLPFEEERDLMDIVALAKEVASMAGRKARKTKLNVSISTFVPKSHTPFMWAAQIPLEKSRKGIETLQKALKGAGIKVKWNQPELSWLEGIFSRGDRRLGRAIMAAWQLGARFDAWGEHFQKDIWDKAFLMEGVDPNFYLYRERPLNERLPWDHIDSGVTKEFLIRELKRAEEGKLSHDCRQRCLECGVCDHKDIRPILYNDKGLRVDTKVPARKKENPLSSQKYRLTFTKLNNARYLSHLELVRVFLRAFRRAGLVLAYSKGFHPMPKVSFASALPVGTESLQETVDIEIKEPLDTSIVKERVNGQLPAGISITDVRQIHRNKKTRKVAESHYLISLHDTELKGENLKKFMESDRASVIKKNKKGEHEIDMKQLVKSASLVSHDRIRLVLRHLDGPMLKPSEVVANIFQLEKCSQDKMKILKIKQDLS